MTKPSGTIFERSTLSLAYALKGSSTTQNVFTDTSTFPQFWKPKIEVLRE